MCLGGGINMCAKGGGWAKTLRHWLYTQLEPEGWTRKGLSATNWILLFVILFSIVLYTVQTEETLGFAESIVFKYVNILVLFVFLIEFLSRLYGIGEREEFKGFSGLLLYVKTNWAMILIDFSAFAPELLFLSVGAAPPSWLRSLRVVRLFKMARYFPAFRLVLDVLRSRVQELLVALALSVVIWYLSAVLLYLAEGSHNPAWFGSITRSMWWSIVTLTTIGYGDTYPETLFGKLAAGLVAVVGVGAVALPSGILAGAFLEKFRQQSEGITGHEQ